MHRTDTIDKQVFDEDLSASLLNLLPEVSSLSSLVTISFIRVEIQIFQIIEDHVTNRSLSTSLTILPSFMALGIVTVEIFARPRKPPQRKPAPQSKPPSPKFGSGRDRGRGDIMILLCRLIFHDHVIKVSCGLMGRSFSW